RGLPNVQLVRGNIQVTAKQDRFLSTEILVEILSEAFHPVQLERKLIASEFGSVRHIDVDNRQAVHSCRDQSLWRGGLVVGKIPLNAFQRVFRNDRNTVICLFADKCSVRIVDCSKSAIGELCVYRFRFLQTQNIRFIRPAPIKNVVQTRIDAVDVPCRDLHVVDQVPEMFSSFGNKPEAYSTFQRTTLSIVTQPILSQSVFNSLLPSRRIAQALCYFLDHLFTI